MAVTQTLTLTEESVDTSANTSKVNILWQSIQTGDSYNNYTRTAYYYVSINGGAETKYSVSYTLPRWQTKTILNASLTVPHKDDGTGTVTVRTWMDTGISADIIEKSATVTLTTIPRASKITSAATITLGSACNIKWTPYSADFRYRLKFSAYGYWSYTTEAIHPNKKTEYTYTGYTMPLSFIQTAINASGNNALTSASVTATLYTYSDSGATVQVGEATSTNVEVIFPDNESTKPNLTMSLAPVPSYTGLESIYLQGRSKVKATFTGSGNYGANITSYSMKVGTNTYSDPYTSGVLGTSGDITVSGIATDSRGFKRTVTQTITVHAYDKPAIITHTGENRIICRRCLADGTPDEEGTYLLIKMGRRYNKVVSGGVQKNFCTLSYRYKTDSQPISSYSDPVTILGASASGDYVAKAIPGVVSNISTAYNIQLIAEDTVGESDVVTITVPSSFVTAHAPEGGHGITFGGYHDPSKHDVFDCKFDAEFHGSVRGSVLGLLGSSGNIPTDGDLNEYKTPGVYAIPTVGDIKNMPVPYPGLLRVYTSIGQTNLVDGAWLNLTQEYQCYDSSVATFRRRLYNDDKYNWSYSKWTSEVASSFETEGDKEVWRIRVREGTNIYDLKVSDSGIEYVKNGTSVWKNH